MTWTIAYYSEDVRLEIDSFPVGIRASYARLTELLEEFIKKTNETPKRELEIARRRKREVIKA